MKWCCRGCTAWDEDIAIDGQMARANNQVSGVGKRSMNCHSVHHQIWDSPMMWLLLPPNASPPGPCAASGLPPPQGASGEVARVGPAFLAAARCCLELQKNIGVAC